MQIFNSLLIPVCFKLPPLTLAFGDFDGLHLGHQKILQKLLSFQDTKSALINFVPNSKAFLQQKEDFFLTSLEQKITFYRFLKLDYLFLWHWNQKLACLKKLILFVYCKKLMSKELLSHKNPVLVIKKKGIIKL
ncbi:hypothetical protein [Candidatus Phytoplasma australiense]|uniref:hypothetical protein n=1 Tax=Phytoplasma australiense TaxID=59748 RepID=UPI0003A7E2A6|nr:hypothetical protein [Candidatus Phytoplasma australiense]